MADFLLALDELKSVLSLSLTCRRGWARFMSVRNSWFSPCSQRSHEGHSWLESSDRKESTLQRLEYSFGKNSSGEKCAVISLICWCARGVLLARDHDDPSRKDLRKRFCSTLSSYYNQCPLSQKLLLVKGQVSQDSDQVLLLAGQGLGPGIVLHFQLLRFSLQPAGRH